MKLVKPPSLSVRVDKYTLNNFKKLAKSTSKEVFGFAIGDVYSQGKLFTVDHIWIPSDWEKYATDWDVHPPEIWFIDADKLARTMKLHVVGTIHSHPPYTTDKPERNDASPSEVDWDGHKYYYLEGICTINRDKNKRLYTRIKWWPQVSEVKVKLC